jgi:L-amino acid N-acyltransferase YncA
VIIRHADPARDGEACAAIYAPYVLDTPISFEEQPPAAEEMSGRIEVVSARYPWLVAEDSGTVVGFAYGSLHRERAAYRWAADVTAYVAPARRRRGTGRALYETLLELLGRQHVRVACAGITLPNEASVALHEACGFEPVGVFRRIGWKAGRWHDVGWWELQLAADPDGPPPEVGPPARLAEPVCL